MTESIAGPSVEITEKGQPSRLLALGGKPVLIGRGGTCEVQGATALSDLHAEIRPTGGGFTVCDLASKTGVHVNGARVFQRRLADGDVVEFGAGHTLRLLFRKGQPAPAAAPAPAPAAVPAAAVAGELVTMAHLARFFAFSRKLAGSMSLDDLLRDVVDLSLEMTGAERGVLVQVAADQSLELKAARDSRGNAIATEGLKISETLVRQAIRTRTPLVVADVGTDEQFSLVASIVSLDLRSAVILPLTRFAASATNPAVVGEVFGALYLDSRRQRGGLDSLDLRILERLAMDTSAAIENVRLLREAEDRRRIDAEVRTAREVQAALIPETFTSTPAFEIAGICVPCNELGGDYVDQFDLGDGRSMLVVADVCGKGIAASLLAATLQGALAAQAGSGEGLDQLAQRLNRVHARLAPAGKFVTMALVELDRDGGTHVVNAGHCPVLHVHAGGLRQVTNDGIALGIVDDAEYRTVHFPTAKDDLVVLYTDGVVECEGPGRELFGEERLQALLAGRRGQSAREVLDAITQAATAFRKDVPVSDDLSVIVIRRT